MDNLSPINEQQTQSTSINNPSQQKQSFYTKDSIDLTFHRFQREKTILFQMDIKPGSINLALLHQKATDLGRPSKTYATSTSPQISSICPCCGRNAEKQPVNWFLCNISEELEYNECGNAIPLYFSLIIYFIIALVVLISTNGIYIIYLIYDVCDKEEVKAQGLCAGDAIKFIGVDDMIQFITRDQKDTLAILNYIAFLIIMVFQYFVDVFIDYFERKINKPRSQISQSTLILSHIPPDITEMEVQSYIERIAIHEGIKIDINQLFFIEDYSEFDSYFQQRLDFYFKLLPLEQASNFNKETRNSNNKILNINNEDQQQEEIVSQQQQKQANKILQTESSANNNNTSDPQNNSSQQQQQQQIQHQDHLNPQQQQPNNNDSNDNNEQQWFPNNDINQTRPISYSISYTKEQLVQITNRIDYKSKVFYFNEHLKYHRKVFGGKALVTFHSPIQAYEIQRLLQKFPGYSTFTMLLRFCRHSCPKMRICQENLTNLNRISAKPAPEVRDILWQNVGIQSEKKVQISAMTLFLTFLLSLLCALLLIYASKNFVTGLIFFLDFILIIAGYSAGIERLAQRRKGSTQSSKAYFIISRTTIFHLVMFILMPVLFYKYTTSQQTEKLVALFSTFMGFCFIICLLYFVDIPYLVHKKKISKIMRKNLGKHYCQKTLNQIFQKPEFPFEMNMLNVMKVWSFCGLHAFICPYTLIVSLFVLIIIYYVTKRQLFLQSTVTVFKRISVQRQYMVYYSLYFELLVLIVYVLLFDGYTRNLAIATYILACIFSFIRYLIWKKTFIKKKLLEKPINQQQNVYFDKYNEFKSTYVIPLLELEIKKILFSNNEQNDDEEQLFNDKQEEEFKNNN